MENKKHKYFSRLRLLAPFFLLLPIPSLFRVLLVYLSDTIDSFWYKLLIDKNFSSDTYSYNCSDKLYDLYSSLFVVMYLLEFNIISPAYAPYILFLFFYRIIGIIFYILTNKVIYFKIFPDALREYVIFILLIDFFKINTFFDQHIPLFFIIIFVLKIIFECIWHRKEKVMNYETVLEDI